jgi:hypothetical protein
MALGSFIHDALADLTPADLARMLELEETLFVEHKSGVSEDVPHGLMKAVSSFANTLGGWVLLGVENRRPVEETPAWAQPGAPPLVDFVRARLRLEIDPLPAFEAKIMPLPDGKKIGVVRVYESADTPHVAIRNGAVFIREVAGDHDVAAPRKPGSGSHGERAYRAVQIRSRAQLLELAERGKSAAQRVDALLDPRHPLPLVATQLPLRLEPLREGGFQPEFGTHPAIVVRMAPLTVSPRFRGWATTADCSAAVQAQAEALSGQNGLDPSWISPDPSGAGLAISFANPVHFDGADLALASTAHLVIDAAGVAGAGITLMPPEDRRRRSWLQLAQLVELLKPVISTAANLLTVGEFLGRSRCQIDLVDLSQAFLLHEAKEDGARRWVPLGAELPLPASENHIDAVARRAANALWRSAGGAAWDAPRSSENP